MWTRDAGWDGKCSLEVVLGEAHWQLTAGGRLKIWKGRDWIISTDPTEVTRLQLDLNCSSSSFDQVGWNTENYTKPNATSLADVKDTSVREQPNLTEFKCWNICVVGQMLSENTKNFIYGRDYGGRWCFYFEKSIQEVTDRWQTE